MHAEGINHKQSSTRIKYSFIKILTGSDLSRRRLPFMSSESDTPGPVLWLTACGHGDEVGGMVVIQEVFRKLKKGGLLRGSLHAFPLMNPIGFETGSRNITMSKEDLNRSFPGNKDGSLAERIADKIFTTIKDTQPDLVLDLHNDWMKSIPYTVLDSEPSVQHRIGYEKAKSFSKTAGFLVILESIDIPKTLSHSLLLQDIPALTLELGESYVVNEKNVEYGVQSIFNVLNSLGMIEMAEEPFSHPLSNALSEREVKFSDQPVSSSSGIIRFLTKPGDIVKQGRPVAKIYNPFGKLQETIVARHSGIVLGHSDSSVAFPGAPVMAFGVADSI